MWLVPLAVIILVSEHVNRDRLTERQSEQLRYLALIVIYVSSTADMFIAGLDTWYFPVVLAVLSILGVFAGILLRVRAFLYLGVTFLFALPAGWKPITAVLSWCGRGRGGSPSGG